MVFIFFFIRAFSSGSILTDISALSALRFFVFVRWYVIRPFFKSVQVYKSTAFIPIKQKLKRKTSFARLYLFVPGCIIKE